MAVAGIRTLVKTTVGRELFVPLNLSFVRCKEIIAGATISSATWSVLLTSTDAISTDLVLSGSAISSDSKVAQILVSVASTATVGNTYTLVCLCTLNTGEVLVGEITIVVTAN